MGMETHWKNWADMRTASEPEAPTCLIPPDYDVDDMDGIAVV